MRGGVLPASLDIGTYKQPLTPLKRNFDSAGTEIKQPWKSIDVSVYDDTDETGKGRRVISEVVCASMPFCLHCLLKRQELTNLGFE